MAEWEETTQVGANKIIMDLDRSALNACRLEQIEGPGAPCSYRLDTDKVIIGRQRLLDITLRSDQVSRRHAQLTRSGNDYQVMDLDSSNGIFLNGVKIHSADLHDGDQIQIGNVVFLYRKAGA